MNEKEEKIYKRGLRNGTVRGILIGFIVTVILMMIIMA